MEEIEEYLEKSLEGLVLSLYLEEEKNLVLINDIPSLEGNGFRFIQKLTFLTEDGVSLMGGSDVCYFRSVENTEKNSIIESYELIKNKVKIGINEYSISFLSKEFSVECKKIKFQCFNGNKSVWLDDSGKVVNFYNVYGIL